MNARTNMESSADEVSGLEQERAESILEAIEVTASNDQFREYEIENIPTHVSKASSNRIRPIKTAQDWDGSDDPGNPLNWSSWKKARHFGPVAFLCFSVTVGSSLISPANEDIAKYFHVSTTAAIVPLSVYVIGLGLGPVIAAPMSEQFGRTTIYKLSAPIFILFLVGSALSKTFASLIICRLLAGLSGAPVLAVGAGTNVDMFPQKSRATTSAIYISAPFLGPAFGPIIGGFAAQFKNWQWTIWCNVFIASAAFLCVLPMEETYKKVILQRRAKKLGLEPPKMGEQLGWSRYVKIMLKTTLARPIQMLVMEPTVLLFALYNTFTFAVLFAFFAAYPYVYGRVYGFDTWQIGLCFAGIGIGVLLACLTGILVDRTVYRRKHAKAMKEGKVGVAPEERLYVAMLGAVGLPVGLFWFAWTARPSIHWIVPILAGIPFAWGNLSLFLSAVLYQIDVYGPLNGASAIAANGLLRYALGGCFPLWTIQMYQALGIGWATSLLGFVCVAMLPIPFVFYKYGPGIRARSRFAS